MKFNELIKKDIIPNKTQIYGEPSPPLKVNPVVKMVNDIFPVLQDLYHPDLTKYLI